MPIMKRSSLTFALVVALALSLTSLVTLQGQNTPKPRSISAAVVDLQKVFNSLEEKKSVEAEIVRRKEANDRTEQERAQEVRALQADLGVLAPDTDAFKQTQAKAEQKAIELEVWARLEKAKLEREAAIQMEGLYLKVLAAIKKKAERDGIDLVLYKDPTESARGRNQQEVATTIQLRKVLYAAPELDITDQITQMLNNEYNNRAKAAK
jgi:Skp family chaperone for outer membrane proteins